MKFLFLFIYPKTIQIPEIRINTEIDNLIVSIKYKISKDSIDNSFEFFEYSELERYNTVRTEDEKETYNGLISGHEIKEGRSSITPGEYSNWEDAVFEYINTHNDNIVSSKSHSSVKFKILDINENSCCKYEEYLNGKLIRQGNAWCKDFNTDVEKEAWREAVKTYKNNHGIQTETQKMQSQIASIQKKVNSLDDGLNALLDLTPPLIEAALAKLITDPCNFASDTIRAIKIAISRINGVPSPIELANYYIKLIKDNIQIATDNIVNSQKDISSAVVTPCLDSIEGISDYFEVLDAEYAEYKKLHSQDFALFEVCMNEPVKTIPTTFGYEDFEETSYDGVYLNNIGNMTYSFDENTNTLTAYKEVEQNIIAKGGLLRSSKPNTNISRKIYSNIQDALQNCWIPLRRAWEEYCKQRGWNPTWNITSGYRPTTGTAKSAHEVGWAIDVQPYHKNNEDKRTKVLVLGDFIYNYCKSNRNIKLDQLLVEYNSRYSIWVHIGYKRPSTGEQRGQYWPDYNAKGSHGPTKKI